MNPLLITGFGTSINVDKRKLIITNKLKGIRLQFYPHKINYDGILTSRPTIDANKKIPIEDTKYFSSLSRICVNAEFGAAITRKITFRSKYKISTTI